MDNNAVNRNHNETLYSVGGNLQDNRHYPENAFLL